MNTTYKSIDSKGNAAQKWIKKLLELNFNFLL